MLHPGTYKVHLPVYLPVNSHMEFGYRHISLFLFDAMLIAVTALGCSGVTHPGDSWAGIAFLRMGRHTAHRHVRLPIPVHLLIGETFMNNMLIDRFEASLLTTLALLPMVELDYDDSGLRHVDIPHGRLVQGRARQRHSGSLLGRERRIHSKPGRTASVPHARIRKPRSTHTTGTRTAGRRHPTCTCSWIPRSQPQTPRRRSTRTIWPPVNC